MAIPQQSRIAIFLLATISTVSWICLIFGNPDERAELVYLDDLDGSSRLTQLAFDATTASASWPEDRNPLKDFDADFLDNKPERGFPRASNSAEWAFTKNPLLGFDDNFKASWKGWEGPEDNVWSDLPPEYPYVETKQSADMKELAYKDWSGSGDQPENNVFGKGYDWPNY